MSLRMNIYGSSLTSFKQVLGSKDSAVLEGATECLSAAYGSHPETLAKAKAWLRTLIEDGFPLRQDREPPSEPGDGGLLTVHMETDIHAFVVHCLVRAIACDDHLDLAEESSKWAHPAVESLSRDLWNCGFTRSERRITHSKQSIVDYHNWMRKLVNGGPLFGDDFRSQWEIYSFFTNQELAFIIPIFQAALEFGGPVPDNVPDHLKDRVQTRLSEGAKRFLGDLIKWFVQIQEAGQDAFIMWW
jgi:hypothetical protein